MESICGDVVSVVFHNPETGYAILRLDAGALGTVVVVGTLGGVSPGEGLEVEGRWVDHPRFGRQFQAQSYQVRLPASLAGVQRFLASGALRGVGPKLAQRLIDHFGPRTLEVLESEPEKLLRVEGIGQATLSRIRASWQNMREIRGLMLFLQEHAFPVSLAYRIFKVYGTRSVEQLRQNPYALAYDVHGVGFRTADALALRLGFPEDSPERIQAGLEFALRQASEQGGHVFLPRAGVLDEAAKLLACSDGHLLAQGLEGLCARKRIVEEDITAKGVPEAVFLSFFHRAERETAARLVALMEHRMELPAAQVEQRLQQETARLGIRLAPEQRLAVETAVTEKVCVITGGPGTGKTTIIRVVARVLRALGLKVGLAAPTGRAAKRLAEATGFAAQTVHRLLKYQPGASFEYGEDNKLPLQALILDEASMLDSALALAVLRALPLGCRLILVGDENQLPSVGPGNVLGDILACGCVPAVQLTHIFRQAETSTIVVNAHRVREGKMPLASPKEPPRADFFWVEKEDPAEVAELVVRLVAERIPEIYGLDPLTEVQVLTPMHKGEVGTAALNERLQAVLNPRGRAVGSGQRGFRVGDRVLQVRNDYEKEVFNGDLGRIIAADPAEGEVRVDFDGREVTYCLDELDNLTLAYAISVHKSQGSEYPAIVFPIVTQHYMLLQRNLIYTGLTRARRLAVLVGSRQALRMGLANERGRARYTALDVRIRQQCMGDGL
ncbi:MAG: ATP-dependent RecD-like DNA helicase [Desulfomicrobiaceae bacterium]